MPVNTIFPIHRMCSKKNRYIAAEVMAFMGKSCIKLSNMSTIFLKFVRKQCLHAYDFYLVCWKRYKTSWDKQYAINYQIHNNLGNPNTNENI